MGTMFQTLLSPLTIGGVTFRNRMAVSPMSTCHVEDDGTVNQRYIDYMEARAKGGYGLIYTEYTTVKKEGRAEVKQLAIYDDRFIPGLKKLTDAVHRHGAKIFVQLHHAGGRGTSEASDGCTESVTAQNCPGCPVLPHELTTEECYGLVGYFADAAERAVRAGFDGVDVHCGHGYLLSDFLSPSMNKRTDEFGGDIYSRARLPILIFKGIKERCGKDFPVTVRMNGEEFTTEGTNPTEARIIARFFEEAGVDAINATVGGDVTQHFALRGNDSRPGSNNIYSKTIKDAVSIPVFTVGRMNDPYYMEDALITGAGDMIVMGRQSLADPEFPNKVAEGRVDDICPCICCDQSCVGYRNISGVSCLANPQTGYESERKITQAAEKKRVVVAGAGPAGMMAAWTAARRGHEVILLEKKDRTGGQFRTAGVAPGKYDVNRLIKYYTRMCEQSGVKLLLNTEASSEGILAMKPDAVILATGGTPVWPQIPGIEEANVLQAADVLNGKALAGGRVLICGGGIVGAELAEFLQDRFAYPVIIDMLPAVAAELDPINRQHMMRRLEEGNPGVMNHLQSILSAKITRFFPDGVAYEQNGEQKEIHGFDCIVLAMGAKPYNPLEEKLKGKVPVLRVAGDALKGGMANKAIEEGLFAAMDI